MNRNLTTLYPIVLFSLFCAGCKGDAIRVEEDFGNSVTQMINGQIYDPITASDPDTVAVEVLDGETASSTVDGYRQSAEFDNRETRREFSLD